MPDEYRFETLQEKAHREWLKEKQRIIQEAAVEQRRLTFIEEHTEPALTLLHSFHKQLQLPANRYPLRTPQGWSIGYEHSPPEPAQYTPVRIEVRSLEGGIELSLWVDDKTVHGRENAVRLGEALNQTLRTTVLLMNPAMKHGTPAQHVWRAPQKQGSFSED